MEDELKELLGMPLSIDVIEKLNAVRHINAAGKEYWHAREIHEIFGYPDYDIFEGVIAKAIASSAKTTVRLENHFLRTSEMVSIGSGAKRKVADYYLSRIACYLVAMEGQSTKPEIGTAKRYFAIKTRVQEIQEIEQRDELTDDERRLFLRREVASQNKALNGAAKAAGVVTTLDYAIFKNNGYKGTYGGLDADGRRRKMGLDPSAKILDHMGSTELAANLFRTTQTEEKLRKEKVQGKEKANTIHHDMGIQVRKAIAGMSGVMPEDLPTAELIREVEKRLKKAGKQLSPKKP